MFEAGWGLAVFALPIILTLNIILSYLGLKSLTDKTLIKVWQVLSGLFSIIIIWLMVIGSRHLILLGILTFFIPQLIFVLLRARVKQHFIIYSIVVTAIFVGIVAYYIAGLSSGVTID